MRKLKIYLDTSVIGGCFDREFADVSNLLFQFFKVGTYLPVISEIVAVELEKAPLKVKKALDALANLEIISITDEIKILAQEYTKAKIVSLKYTGDALHIAAATIIKADVLVSWNFKHIVNLRKIHEFNAVNLAKGYNILEIRTPRELIES